MKERDTFSIQQTVRGKLPSVPFKRIKEAVLGKGYILALIFIGNTRSQSLNAAYRGKKQPTNILSFPYSKTEGEIFIAPDVLKKEARRYGYPYAEYCGRIFIHGLFHLKGYAHSSTMEEKEERMRKKFNIA